METLNDRSRNTTTGMPSAGLRVRTDVHAAGCSNCNNDCNDCDDYDSWYACAWFCLT